MTLRLEAYGFRVDEVRHPVRNGVVLENFAMSRSIRPVEAHRDTQ